eukprot:731020-Amphidinium_carterae.1
MMHSTSATEPRFALAAFTRGVVPEHVASCLADCGFRMSSGAALVLSPTEPWQPVKVEVEVNGVQSEYHISEQKTVGHICCMSGASSPLHVGVWHGYRIADVDLQVTVEELMHHVGPVHLVITCEEPETAEPSFIVHSGSESPDECMQVAESNSGCRPVHLSHCRRGGMPSTVQTDTVEPVCGGVYGDCAFLAFSEGLSCLHGACLRVSEPIMHDELRAQCVSFFQRVGYTEHAQCLASGLGASLAELCILAHMHGTGIIVRDSLNKPIARLGECWDLVIVLKYYPFHYEFVDAGRRAQFVAREASFGRFLCDDSMCCENLDMDEPDALQDDSVRDLHRVIEHAVCVQGTEDSDCLDRDPVTLLCVLPGGTKDDDFAQIRDSNKSFLEKALALAWIEGKQSFRRSTLKTLLKGDDDLRGRILAAPTAQEVAAIMTELMPARDQTMPAPPKKEPTVLSGWQVVDSDGRKSKTRCELLKEEWAPPPVDLLVCGHSGVKLMPVDEVASKYHQLVGGGGNLGIVSTAKPEKVPDEDITEVAFHVVKITEVIEGTFEKEVVAVNGFLTHCTTTRCKRVEAFATHVIKASSSIVLAIDFPKSEAPEGVWSTLMQGRISMAKDQLRASWTFDIDYNVAILDVFKLTKASDTISVLARCSEDHIKSVMSLSGTSCFYVRPIGPKAKEYAIVWLPADKLKSHALAIAKDLDAAGVVLGKGKYGLRVLLDAKESVLRALNLKDMLTWQLTGLPKESTCETAAEVATIFCKHPEVEVVLSSRRLVGGRPSWLVRIPSEATLETDVAKIEAKEAGNTVTLFVCLTKFASRNTERLQYVPKKSKGTALGSGASGSNDPMVRPVDPPKHGDELFLNDPWGVAATKKRKQDVESQPVIHPAPAVSAQVLSQSAARPSSSSPSLEQVETIVNSNLQQAMARIEAMLSSQTAFVQTQIQDLNDRLGADDLEVDEDQTVDA